MVLLEIAAQGVRGLTLPGGRATLRAGYNVVAADGPVLRRLLEALLWPDPRDVETVPRAGSGPGGAGVRGGVTVVGNDGVTYRLVRDLAAGCQLHRFDPERRSFSLVSQDLAGIARYLRGPVGLPDRSRFAALLTLSAAELPSRQPSSGLHAGAGAAIPARKPLSPAQAQSRIAELRGELARAQAAEKLQYRMDGLQSRLFKLEEELRAGQKIREGLDAAEAALRELKPVRDAIASLRDVDARVAAFEKAAARRDETLAKVGEERQVLDAAAEGGGPAPFWKDPRFLAGAGAGMVALVAGVAGRSSSQLGLRYLALLDIPAFGYAAWVALRWVGDLEEGERSGRRRRFMEERERKTLEQYERDTGEVRGIMKALGLSALADLKEALGRLADAQAVAAEWRRRLEEYEAKPESRDARQQRDQVQAEIQAVEAQLAGEAGGYVREPRSIEAEISRIESEAAAPMPPPVPAAAPLPPGVDPLKGLLERAAQELSTSPAGAVRALQKRLAEMVPVLSAQRLDGCVSDDRGNVVVRSGGRAVPSLTLPAADRDVVFLALKLALMEQSVAAGKTLAFSEDAFAVLPEASRRAAARLLKQAARGGQILHATSDAIFREAADHSA